MAAPPACTRDDPTIDALNTPQSGAAKTTLHYNFNGKNTDSLGCPNTNLSFSIIDCPPGWTCASTAAFNVPPQTQVMKTIDITSAAGAVPGDYNLTAQIQNVVTLRTGTTTIRYTVTAAPVCTPDGCNGNCPAGCTVAQDPDCGCQGGNGCCGIRCNNASDSDCPPVTATCTDILGVCERVADCTAPYHCNNNPLDCVSPTPCCCIPPPACGGCDTICPTGCTVAQDPDCGCQGGNGCCGIGCNNSDDPDCPVSSPFTWIKIVNPLKAKSFEEFIDDLINFIFWIAAAIFPIIIIIAGFLFLTSGGDPEKIRTAKRMILWTIIGLAIVLLAKGIISLIKAVISK
jgi:hypothetical protein